MVSRSGKAGSIGAGTLTATMNFRIVGEISDAETIARSSGIRELPRPRRMYGHGSWRKGVARIRLRNGSVRLAEPHWCETHGIGRKEFKRKRYLD